MAHRQGSLPASRRELIAILGGTAAACWVSCLVSWPLAAHAQQPSSPAVGFPSKLLRIIVPFTPGGSNDVVAREIATGLQGRLNQTAVVENKPGAGGNIAYSYVAKSPADGYLMLIAPASFTIGPHLSQSAQSGLDFAPINLVADAVRHGRAGCVQPGSHRNRWREIAGKVELVGRRRHAAASRAELSRCSRRGSVHVLPRRHGGPAGSGGGAHRHSSAPSIRSCR